MEDQISLSNETSLKQKMCIYNLRGVQGSHLVSASDFHILITKHKTNQMD